MATAPFVVDPVLTAIAVGYRNEVYIADDLCPKKPVSAEEFRFTKYPVETSYTVPDTRVGRLSQPNTVSVSGTEDSAFTEDFGLDGPIPQKDLDKDAGKHNIRGAVIEKIMNAVMLDREQRVAALYGASANYAAGLALALSGADRFSQAASDPLGVLLDALDKPLMRPNTITMSKSVWTRLRRHPRLVKAIKNENGEGAISRQQLADELEIQNIRIGESRINIARPGREMTLERVWGNFIALTYQNPSADFSTGGITFALTAQWGGRIGGEYQVPTMGLRGGTVVRAGEAVRELAIAPHAGFLLQNVI